MSTDNTSGANDGNDLSPEVADALGLSPSQVATNAPVKPVSTEKKAPSDKKTDDKKTTPTKKTSGEDEKTLDPKPKVEEAPKEGEEEIAQPTVYKVAGKEYASFEEATKAINRISGDNTRLAGDLNKARQEAAVHESKVTELTKLLNDFQVANKAWQDYFEKKGDKPDTSSTDITTLVRKTVEEQEQQRNQATLKVQYQTELDEVFQEDDIKDVMPYFKALVDEYDGQPKVSPKILYKRARAQYRFELAEKRSGDPDEFDKEVEAAAQRKVAKQAATKVSGAGGQRAATKKSEDQTLSPEVADALRDLI